MFFLTVEYLQRCEKTTYDLSVQNWWAVKYREMEKEDGLKLGWKSKLRVGIGGI